MQVKLIYDGKGGTEFLRYLQLTELPATGQVLDVGGGVMLQVLQVTSTPESMFQKAVALVRVITAGA